MPISRQECRGQLGKREDTVKRGTHGRRGSIRIFRRDRVEQLRPAGAAPWVPTPLSSQGLDDVPALQLFSVWGRPLWERSWREGRCGPSGHAS